MGQRRLLSLEPGPSGTGFLGSPNHSGLLQRLLLRVRTMVGGAFLVALLRSHQQGRLT